jgi:hypothetical protein
MPCLTVHGLRCHFCNIFLSYSLPDQLQQVLKTEMENRFSFGRLGFAHNINYIAFIDQLEIEEMVDHSLGCFLVNSSRGTTCMLISSCIISFVA